MKMEKTTEPRIIVHVPHSSIIIPEMFRREFLAGRETLRRELLCMTDWYTDELFFNPECLVIVHRCSRLVCDPERFLDPEEECMWQKGMGMYYTRASDGARLKRCPLSSKEGWSAYGQALEIYQQHHIRLRAAVQRQLDVSGRALLIDGHSFSSTALPYELPENVRRRRPEICLGTDPVFTPAELLKTAEEYFVRAGLNVSVNTPFAGTMVPEPFYLAKDTRVESLMIEVNRSLYMDEKSGRKKETFAEVKKCVQGCLELLGSRAWQRTGCGNT